MTAIFGYANAGKKGNPAQSFLVADDLEGTLRADKITLLGGRFAVATAGNGALANCVEFLNPFCFPGHHSAIDSVPVLANKLQGVIARFMPFVHDRYKKEMALGTSTLTDKGLKELERLHELCVVLDCVEHKLWFIYCGQTFSTNGPLSQLTPDLLEDRTPHGFALLSSNVTQPEPYNPVETLPWELAKQKIKAAQKDRKDAVGNVGAYVECLGEKIKFRSCFKSPLDRADEELKKNISGFQINIVCAKRH